MTATKIACVVMGDMSLLIRCGDDLLERGHAIAAVITENDAVSQWAGTRNLKVVSPKGSLAADLAHIDFDWFFSIGNLKLVPRAVWGRARKGAANFHDGPLPRFAGLNAPAWAILAGETQYGVTWHSLADQVDGGGVYVQRLFDLDSSDTAFSLNTKCFEAGSGSFLELLDMIERDTVNASSQDLSARTYYSRNARPKAAATIDFSATTAEIDRLGRALTFGANYLNPLALPKIRVGNQAYNVTAIDTVDGSASAPPGTVVSAGADGAVVATMDGCVRIAGLSNEAGADILPGSVLGEGQVIAALSGDDIARLDGLVTEVARHEAYFRAKLAVLPGIELSGLRPSSSSSNATRWEDVTLAVPSALEGDRAAAGLIAALLRTGEPGTYSVPVVTDRLAATTQAFKGYVGATVPLVASIADDTTCEALSSIVQSELAELHRRHAYCGDLIGRTPGVSAPQSRFAVRLAGNPATAAPVDGFAVTFVIPVNAGQTRVIYDATCLPRIEAEAMARRLSVALSAFAADSHRLIVDLPLMAAEEEAAVIHDRNATECVYDREATIHGLIEAQCDRTPTVTALVCEGETLTYAELDKRANCLASVLIAKGVAPDTPVGLHVHRSCDLVVGALAILKAGGAYVPLDPTYPADRVALMIEDSAIACLITSPDLALPPLPQGKLEIVGLDETMFASASDMRLPPRATADNLAYVIYTSGSTGRPKGVMIEHRNAVNFFAGMDERIPRAPDRQPVWLAVTSLSFDISVLELFWTLARGFKVVIHTDNKREVAAPARPRRRPTNGRRSMDLSLFYWGNDDGPGARKYQLLLEGARFADTHGFRAVWTPERHFHAFGGPYPNPSVTGAAVAALTRNVDIRAGSCVLPLHHPARVAEEWAVIDNMSDGRVALAFASGWMPEDFLLRPENAPPNNKTSMLRDIEIVRKLWRGDEVVFNTAAGKPIKVTTLPRPVQKELPVWLTTAGNVETFREAARIGANVLTHLLGQPINEVAQKIKAYRETLAACGRDPAQYTVTLMLHTLIGKDREEVREQAREPMKAYLRSAAALIKQYAWEFPAFRRPQGVDQPNDVNLQSLDADELDAIIEFAFLRYFDTSGLFGTVDDAVARVEQLTEIGVDEIACLIDFGLPTDLALRALEPLAGVVAAIGGAVEIRQEEQSYRFADLVVRHGVTHLQCTPSMATMLLMEAENHPALSRIRHLFLGGEAVTGSLVRALGKVTSATVENMYGPTETTIWSSTGPAADTDGTVPLGKPIANTQLYVLDRNLRALPPGLPGELYIGGDGVARGYLHRPDLTSERFKPNPFVQGGRMYSTGDLVCLGHDGALAFLGRVDHQVKLRGHRIELGEIEACIRRHPGVADAVVVMREDSANDSRLVAYLRAKAGRVPDAELRTHVRKALPEFMVPSHFVALKRFPLTPNAKVDRKALPRPDAATLPVDVPQPFAAPHSDVEQEIAKTFGRVLGVQRVGLFDNFFSLGGHSLLAVQAHRDLKASIAPNLSIIDVYRFPTVAALAGHIRDRRPEGSQLEQAAGRAAARRNALLNRRVAGARGRDKL